MQATLVLYNGNIHTMDATRPRVEAVAITHNRILAVGDNEAMQALLAPNGQAIDLAGQTVTPGFNDAHLHFLSYGFKLGEIDVDLVPTPEEALRRVKALAAETPAGRWLKGRGWDQSIWSGGAFPTATMLDAATTEHPVFLRRKCGHVGWANSMALAQAGITATTVDPPGGEIERDPQTGQPTGILKERAMRLVFDVIPEPTAAENREALLRAIASVHAYGITSVGNMEDTRTFQALQDLKAAGKLSVRVLMQIPEERLDGAIAAGVQSGFGDDWLKIGGVKIFADGSLGGRTAFMLEPYQNEPDNVGIVVSDADHLNTVVEKAARAGLASMVHAIGDRSNREVLDAVERTRRAGIGLHLRHRIEHAQILHPDDLPRFAELGVIASPQPIHCVEDMVMAQNVWGERCAGAYAWRSLIDSGAHMAFSSDAPVSTPNVILGLHAAITRRRLDGYPGPDGWHGEQRLTIEEAVNAYTMEAAYAAGEETLKGSLTPGKLADLTVLSQDIFTISPDALLETDVTMTVVDGRVVYQQD
jgi:predicted amidohydrolase YtcJ